MLRDHAIVRAEMQSVELALEKYATAHAITPPSGLKDKIMEQIQENIGGKAPADNAVQPGKGASSGLFKVLSAVLATASLLLAFFANSLYTQNKTQQLRYAELEKKFTECSNRSEINRQIATFIRDRDTKAIDMTDGKYLKIAVFTNEVRQETYLDMSGIAPASQGLYYQFWAIVDGMPVSLGMVDIASVGGIQSFKYLKNVQAFAISQENNPQGNALPTIVVAQGKTS